MTANGGNGYNLTTTGGGGGGRVYYTYTTGLSYVGSLAVNGGTGYLAGAGGSTVAANPAPVVTSISPTSGTAGSGNMSVTITGTGFVVNSVGQWNGSNRSTTYVSSTQLTMTILGTDIANGGTGSITVFNTTPAGGLSSAQTFTMNNPVSTITSLSPSSVVYGGVQFTLTVNGTSIVPSSVVNWNGSPRTTTYVSATQLTATITAADIASVGTANITIVNPTPGGGASTASTFTFGNPVPTTSSLSPTNVQFGASQFTLTVNGSNFVSSAVINWNGNALTTTYVSSTQLTAVISAANVSSAGAMSVTVSNPAPGGGTSSALTFNVTNPTPTLSSISQTSSNAGGSQFTLTLTGTNFIPASIGQWNGSNRSTIYVSATQIGMIVLASDLASGGTDSVTVSNPTPGGGVTSAKTYTVNNLVPTISSLDPSSGNANTSVTIAVSGSNFVPTSVVKWNGVSLPTNYYSSSYITGDLPGTYLTSESAAAMTVTNPAPGGGTSSGKTFTVYSVATTCPTSGTNVTISGACNFDAGTYNYSGTLTVAAPVTFTASSTMTFNADVTVASGGSITQKAASLVTINGALVVQSGGSMTHAQNTTAKTHVLNVVANSIEIDSGATVDVAGKGYASGYGTGYGNTYGAGYGGNGGGISLAPTKGITYGSATQPTDLGSSGPASGSNGGGAVKLVSLGDFTNNGTISANGVLAQWSGSSGGSVWLQAGNNFYGSGTVRANGASAVSNGWYGGGGGRIALYSSSDNSSMNVTAYGGVGVGALNAGAGTIYRNTSGQTNGDLVIDNNGVSGGYTTQATSAQTFDNLTFSNGGNYVVGSGQTLTIPSGGSVMGAGSFAALTVNGTFNSISSLDLTGYTLYDNGTINNVQDVTIGSGGTLSQGTTTPLVLSGKLWVKNGGSLTHAANTTAQSAVVNISAADVEIDTGANVNVDGKGYAAAQGPGAGNSSIGAGHGGLGGAYTGTSYGAASDSVSGPSNIGAGGSGVGAIGGGAVKIISSGAFVMDGTITADAIAQSSPQWSGAAGGSVWIQAATDLSGSGTITVNGGKGQGTAYGGGAGGRVALIAGTNSSSLLASSNIQAYGGLSAPLSGAAGTIYSKFGTDDANIVIDNNGVVGAKTPQVNTTETYDDVTVVNKANYEIPNGKTLVVAANHTIIGGNGGTVTVDAGGTLSGTADALVSSANIVNNGTISAANFQSSGTFTQNGTLTATTLTVANSTYYYYGGSLGFDNLDVASGGVFVFAASGTYSNDVTFPGDVTVENGGLITSATNTSATKVYYANITANNITVQAGGRIDVSGKGSPAATGPGAGNTSGSSGSGAGYGGVGGTTPTSLAGGSVYGSSTEPTDIGSGGGTPARGSAGGGAMKLVANDTMTIDGTLAANGANATQSYGGGGSGGSVWIVASTLACNGDGTLSVLGGDAVNSNNGGGAGGRISYTGTSNLDMSCSLNTTGGAGYLGAAAAGTTNAVSPLPVLTSMSPSSVLKGTGNTTVTLTGTGFVSSSYGQWNGNYRVTTFVSATQLNMTVLASDLAASGTADVTVFSPAPGGGVSEVQTFTIRNPVPVVSGLNPNYRYVNAADYTLNVSGSNYVPTSVVQWNGQDRPTTYISSSSLNVAITKSDFAVAGNIPITVTNPAPGGGVSNAMNVSVNNIRPTLTSMDPTAALVGSDDVTITLTGTDFVPTTYAHLSTNTKSQDLVTTYVTTTQMTAVIPASFLTSTGNMTIVVYSPNGGGQSYAGLIFSASNAVPTITSISPSSGTAGLSSQPLIVTGTGFIYGSTVYMDGVSIGGTFNSTTQLTAGLTAAQLSTAGTHTIKVWTAGPGGGYSDSYSYDLVNGTPNVTALSPSTAFVGSGDTTVTVYGTGFVTNSVVQWNGTDLVTTYQSNSQVRAIVPSANLSSVGDSVITVVNPEPGGGSSGEKTFSVTNPLPVLSLITPTSTVAGSDDLTLTVYGSGFVDNSTVYWKGNARTTTYVSSTSLMATIPSTDLPSSGTMAVTVVTPTPGGGTSATKYFTVNNPLPIISDTQPSSAYAGAGSTALTVNGSNFISGSYIQWNGIHLSTVFVSANQLTASIPYFYLTTVNDYPITVFSPTPGGGTSDPSTFSVLDATPVLNSISPTTAPLNQSFVALTVNGSSFSSGSVVRWNGTNLTTSFVSGSQLTATIPGTDLTSVGAASITVLNPSGVESDPQTFTVTYPSPSVSTVSPGSALIGSTDLTVTITGTRFVPDSIVRWNGVDRSTTYVSGSKLTFVVPTADMASVGSNMVTVFNPAPGGGTSSATGFAVNYPAPTVSGINPTNVLANVGDTTVTVTGSGFVSGSHVRWNGTNLTTTFVSDTELSAVIPAASLTTPGAQSITVNTSTPGGGTSSAQTFTINFATPTITSLSATSGVAGQASFTLNVYGTGFAPGSVIQWDGSTRSTSYVSPTRVSMSVGDSDLAIAGTHSVTVYNKTPGGGTSSPASFDITNPAPSLSSISPSAVAQGSGNTVLTAYGTGFVQGSVIRIDGQDLTTTYYTSGRVTAVVSSSYLTNVVTSTITIVNAAPGGGTSGSKNFAVVNNAPVLSSLSQTSAALNAAGFTLTATGSNFDSGATIQWNGQDLSTTYVNATQVRAALSWTYLATAGVNHISVVSGAGVSSGQIAFTVNNPTPTLTNISPITIPGGSTDMTLTVNGTNFTPDSVVQWAGSNRTTTYVSSTQLTATILTTDLASSGSRLVTVQTPTPGGGITSSQTFTVSGSLLGLDSIMPTSAYVHASYVTLTLNGSLFTEGSVVKWNGTPLTTTYLSSNQLSADVPGSDLLIAGSAQVTVTSDTGVTTPPQTFTINNPTPSLTTLSPAAAYVQGTEFTMTVTGLGFLSTSIVKWNGTPVVTTYVNDTTLHVQVPAQNIATTGSAVITVTNSAPGGGASNSSTFLTVDRLQGNSGQVVLRAAVTNVPPTAAAPIVATVSGGSSVSSFNLVAGSSTTMFVHGTVSDENGCETLTSVAVKVYLEDAGSNCTPDGDSCAGTTTNVLTSCTPGTTDAQYEVSLPMPYNMEPTDAGAPYEGKKWFATVTVTDHASATGIGTNAGFDMNSLIAFDVTPAINYGLVQFGQTSQKQTLTFSNKGNRVLKSSFLANGPLVCQGGGTIPPENVRLSLQATDIFDDMTSVSAASPKTLLLGLAKKVSGTEDPTANMYAQLLLPQHAGVTGSCSNALTFTASGQ